MHAQDLEPSEWWPPADRPSGLAVLCAALGLAFLVAGLGLGVVAALGWGSAPGREPARRDVHGRRLGATPVRRAAPGWPARVPGVLVLLGGAGLLGSRTARRALGGALDPVPEGPRPSPRGPFLGMSRAGPFGGPALGGRRGPLGW